MQTFLATYRLRQSNAERTATIRDFGLQHAAARAAWRPPAAAAERGWHAGHTDLVAVELVTESVAEKRPPAKVLEFARAQNGCRDEARRLVTAATEFAGCAG
jgi:hypothetical protein